jgi:hypothetical protein
MNRMPPENKRSYFEDKYERGTATECWPWHRPVTAQTSFSWVEGVGTPQRKNYALNLRRTALHYAGVEVPAGAAVWQTCRNLACCNPDHMQVLAGPGRMKFRGSHRGGRPTIHTFTDSDLELIWNNPDNLGAPAFGRYFGCTAQLINNIQNGWRLREDIERIMGPQVYWGRNRIRKYMDATQNSTRNSRNTTEPRSGI